MNIMIKKISLFAIAAIALASCTKEAQPQPEPQPEDPKAVVSFDATASDCVKTVLTDGVKTYWQSNDAISVLYGTTNARFSTTLSQPAASATFKGQAEKAATYYAVYPYSSSASLSGAVITTNLPSTQTAVANSFDPNAELLACKSTTTSLNFLPAVAVLKINVGTEGAVSVKVSANGNEGIAGTATLSLSSSLTVSGGNVSNVTLANTGGEALATGVYYVTILPKTLASGIKITLTNASSQTITKSTTASKTFDPGIIYDMGTISGSWAGEETTKIFTDSMQNGWKLGGTTGKYEICSEPSNSGNQVIKWTVDDAGSWARVLTLEPATAPTDISACTAIRFKMKFANSTCTAGNTVFQNRVYGKDSESYCNVYAPSDSEWQTVTMKFSDFTAQSGTDIWTKLNNFCFHTPGWYSGTATIYFDDIELLGSIPGPEPEESIVLFDDVVKTGWTLGGTEDKYAISTDYASSGTKSIKWTVDSYSSWSRILTLGLDEGSIDVSGYTTFSFKMKLVGASTTEKQTFARIQVVDAKSAYTEVNIYSDVTDWTTVSFNIADFSGPDMSKLKNLCFYTPGWYAVTATVYIDEVKFTK